MFSALRLGLRPQPRSVISFEPIFIPSPF
jgi:hypothetical protein